MKKIYMISIFAVVLTGRFAGNIQANSSISQQNALNHGIAYLTDRLSFCVKTDRSIIFSSLCMECCLIRFGRYCSKKIGDRENYMLLACDRKAVRYLVISPCKK